MTEPAAGLAQAFSTSGPTQSFRNETSLQHKTHTVTSPVTSWWKGKHPGPLTGRAWCTPGCSSTLPAQECLQLHSYWGQGELVRHGDTIRATQVTHENHGLGPMVQAVLDGRNSCLDSVMAQRNKLIRTQLPAQELKSETQQTSGPPFGMEITAHLWLLVILWSFIGTLKSTLKKKKTEAKLNIQQIYFITYLFYLILNNQQMSEGTCQ